MLPLKKLYIDSRDRTADSKSSSNFKIELPYTVEMPDNTVFFVTDVCIPNVWQTIETGFNDRLYLYFRGPDIMNGQYVQTVQQTYKVVTLDQNNYTLAALAEEIQKKLRAALDPYMISAGASFNVTFNGLSNSLTITMTGSNTSCSFRLLTDQDVQLSLSPILAKSISWVGDSIDPGNLKSANGVISHAVMMLPTMSWTSGFVNLQHIHNIYITSPNLGSFDTISTFSNNIIKKVPITGAYGMMIVDQLMSTNDYLNCSKQTLRTLEFHLRDGRGNEVDLKGMPISFSLVFNKYSGDL